MAVQTYTGELVVEECYKCGMAFGMPPYFHRQRREKGGDFCCPQGHGQHYITTEVQRLKNELAREQHRREQAETDASRQRGYAQATERRLRATRGVVTRTKNRIARGVCPCCNRYFADLHRHMETQHPDYADSGDHEA